MAAVRLAHLLVHLAAPAAAAGLGCLDAAGQAIDYWYAFKHPEGTQYTYSDARNPELAAATGGLDGAATALTRTLVQAYASGIAYAMYNDGHPDGTTVFEPLAHMKGVVAFTKDGGFWLTHSLPHFPQSVATGFDGSWETASQKYAQHFFCLSLGTEALTTLGSAMVINQPSVYDKAAPPFAAQAVPNFESWLSGEYHRQEIASKAFKIQTLGGVSFDLFAKSADFGKDLYAALVAPDLGEDLLTETWQNGRGNLPDACRGSGDVQQQVETIRSVEIGGESWRVEQDHSKWAVSTSGSVFCVGDINRQEGQFKRGGGTTCSREAKLAGQMRKAVTDFSACGSVVVNRTLLV